MATKDNSHGLLSKMAKFVRNPTTNWSDLDKVEAEQDSSYSKVALKEIIERKRQNDFVRRREFDYLRKLRRNGPSPSEGLISRPSFFQTSIASNQDERAMTLRKIDEIEAQMSKQWWKGRQDPGTAPLTVPPADASTLPASFKPYAGDKSSFSSTMASETSPGPDSFGAMDYASTQMGQYVPTEPASELTTLPLAAFNLPAGQHVESGISDFSTSNLFSLEAPTAQTDPEIEEAAIRFANGDDAGAEVGLLSALQGADVSPDSADRWAGALFDLYRATGQQSSFDSVAIDYAIRFGRSAPAWFSVPDLLGRKPLPSKPGVSVSSKHNRPIVWECPVVFDLSAAQSLLDLVGAACVPIHLHWGQLGSITPAAARLLGDLFQRWCSQPVSLHFGGVDVLDITLRSLTPSGDKTVELFWWQLRLDALRILRLQDEFELAALDYCVTFEVSPPPWQDACCELVQRSVESVALPELSPFGMVAAAEEQALATDFAKAVTVPAGSELLRASQVALNGEVLGDAVQALDVLQASLKGSGRLVISCSLLIRVDFSAAGSILNWVAVRQSEGCDVQFRDVPRLVAAFFNVIGINEHARVVLRTR